MSRCNDQIALDRMKLEEIEKAMEEIDFPEHQVRRIREIIEWRLEPNNPAAMPKENDAESAERHARISDRIAAALGR